MSQRRRSSLLTGVASGERRKSAGVQQYALDKVLDPKSLDKIIYQAGIGYQAASSTRVSAASAGALEFDISGFSTFLSQSKCLSVLLFWKEAEEYLNMFSQKERAACSQKIFQRYLKHGAEYEINLTGVNDKTIADIEKQLGNPPESLFEETQQCAYKMMSLELFPRFWDAVKQQFEGSGDNSQVLTSDSTLKDVLSDEKEVLLFSEYCKIHYCEEQVLFWLETNDHKLLFDPRDMLAQGQRLYDVYIDEAKSESRINISHKADKDIQAKLSTGTVDRTLFDGAMVEVEGMLELDVWPRYKEAVISGEYDPVAGKADVAQHDQQEDTQVDLSKPSKAAVRITLKKPAEFDKLRAAAAKQGCAEMVDWCKECAEYEKLFSNADRTQKAQAMWKKYLAQGCDAPVNIPDTQLKDIQKKLDMPTASLFKKAFDECVKLIADNVYGPYLDEEKAVKAAKEQEKADADAAKAAPAAKAGGGGCCVVS